MLGRKAVGVVADGFLELLALVLRQQLLEHALAHALLDAALGDGVEVHEAGEVDHVVREDAQRLAVEVERHVVDADGVKLAGLVAGHDMAGVEEDLARARVGDGIGELLAVDAGPQGELLIELVAADHGQIIAARIEEEVLDEALAGLDRGRLARTELAVDLQHGLLIGLAGVLLQRDLDAVVVAEEVEDAGVGLEVGVLLGLTADGADQLGDGDLAVLVDADPEHLVGVGLILQPRAAVGDHGAGEQGQVGLEVDLLAVVHARGADDLADDHALGAVDDEGAGLGHEREIAHEDLLLLDLLRLVVVQPHVDLERSGIGGVARLALLHVVLGGLIHLVADEAQLKIARVVGDRGDVGEHLLQSLVEEPPVGLLLELQKIRHLHDLLMSSEVFAKGLAVHLVFGHFCSSRLSFPAGLSPAGNVLVCRATRTALLIEMLHLLLCFFVSCAILVAMGEGSLCAYSHI